jgi:hypothetical protein
VLALPLRVQLIVHLEVKGMSASLALLQARLFALSYVELIPTMKVVTVKFEPSKP